MEHDQGTLEAPTPNGEPDVELDEVKLVDPECVGMEELPFASKERTKVADMLSRRATARESNPSLDKIDVVNMEENANKMSTAEPLFIHLSNGLAYTTGSALGCTPPTVETCLNAYLVPNKAGLTSGSRAWSKHFHRSFISPEPEKVPLDTEEDGNKSKKKSKVIVNEGWWGRPSGPVKVINEKSLQIFWKVINNATWRNLHWLPHEILVYEVRVKDGYGMRWAQDRSNDVIGRPWIFRGFLEPQMEGGHDIGWRHTI